MAEVEANKAAFLESVQAKVEELRRLQEINDALHATIKVHKSDHLGQLAIQQAWRKSKTGDPDLEVKRLETAIPAVPSTKPKAKVGCAFAGRRESGWEFRRSASALDCSTVRQRRLTSSCRLASPAEKFPNSFLYCLFWSQAQVASGLLFFAQPQMAYQR